jgi:hypothetical protein
MNKIFNILMGICKLSLSTSFKSPSRRNFLGALAPSLRGRAGGEAAVLFLFSLLFLTSCGTKKTIESPSPVKTVDTSTLKKLDYVRKVYSNATNSKNLVSKIDFTIDAMGKNISVDGKIYMRKDEVIRVVLSPFGLMEVGRVEFTPDYVLVVDRMHKQYVKATYNELSFLKNNGLNFYSLQALFWNELFLPGNDKLTDKLLDKFDAEISTNAQRKVTAKSGNLNFVWDTTSSNGRINAANVAYGTGTANASNASWQYDSFSALGSKQFPAYHAISFASKAVKSNSTMKVNIRMKKLTTDSNWETRSTVSEKYTKVNAEEALKKILQF